MYAFCSLLEYALPRITGFDVLKKQAESFSSGEQPTQSIGTSEEESVPPETGTEIGETNLDSDFESDFEI